MQVSTVKWSHLRSICLHFLKTSLKTQLAAKHSRLQNFSIWQAKREINFFRRCFVSPMSVVIDQRSALKLKFDRIIRSWVQIIKRKIARRTEQSWLSDKKLTRNWEKWREGIAINKFKAKQEKEKKDTDDILRWKSYQSCFLSTVYHLIFSNTSHLILRVLPHRWRG